MCLNVMADGFNCLIVISNIFKWNYCRKLKSNKFVFKQGFWVYKKYLFEKKYSMYLKGHGDGVLM